jgi:hypothetical protein
LAIIVFLSLKKRLANSKLDTKQKDIYLSERIEQGIIGLAVGVDEHRAPWLASSVRSTVYLVLDPETTGLKSKIEGLFSSDVRPHTFIY